MEFPSRYNLITLIYCDFGVLSKTVRRKLLSKIFNSLLPHGVFLFDVFTPAQYAGTKEMRDWEICQNGFWREELCLALHSFYCYEEDHTFLNQYAIVTENDISYYNIWEHTFTLEELEADMREAGFNRIHVYGDIAGKKYEAAGNTICVAAGR